MAAYINTYSLISPQDTFNSGGFPDNLNECVTDRLKCIEPDYRALINPLQLRRMPRILKMGLAPAVSCLQKVGEDLKPDAIIVGTGLGCLENLEKFLHEVLENNEHVTSVLPFINSTHNAVASQIAMLLKNHNYNYTYCHRAFSFESALSDALLHIHEKPSSNVLVGGIDECTDNYMLIHKYLGAWKGPLKNTELFTQDSPGTISGEGSAFFLLSGEKSKGTKASISDVHTCLITDDRTRVARLKDELSYFLGKNNHGMPPDVVIMGLSGDKTGDGIYTKLMDEYFDRGVCFAAFKHLCGEYYTASAFALWLATVIARDQNVPDIVRLNGSKCNSINHILIVNSYNNSEYSFIMVSALKQ